MVRYLKFSVLFLDVCIWSKTPYGREQVLKFETRKCKKKQKTFFLVWHHLVLFLCKKYHNSFFNDSFLLVFASSSKHLTNICWEVGNLDQKLEKDN